MRGRISNVSIYRLQNIQRYGKKTQTFLRHFANKENFNVTELCCRECSTIACRHKKAPILQIVGMLGDLKLQFTDNRGNKFFKLKLNVQMLPPLSYILAFSLPACLVSSPFSPLHNPLLSPSPFILYTFHFIFYLIPSFNVILFHLRHHCILTSLFLILSFSPSKFLSTFTLCISYRVEN